MANRNRSNHNKVRGKGKSSKTGTYQTNKNGNKPKNMRRAEEAIDTVEQLAQDLPRSKASRSYSRTNDIRFYTNAFPEFALDAAKLSFAQVVGTPFPTLRENLEPTPTANINGDQSRSSIPGVMALRFSMVPGVSKDFTSPINRASIKYWTYLRSIQKASGPYDHQDVTMMLWAVDSCIAFHSLMRRAYGVLNNFTPVNSYYPRALVYGSGFDYQSLKEHIQDFRAYINHFGYNLGQYVLPKDITLLDRHQWMCEGIYVDGQSTKAQTYLFVPQGFWQYDNTVPTGSQLVYKDWAGLMNNPTFHNFDAIVEFGNSLLNAISNEQDFAWIAGDMHAFYGDNVYTLPYVDEDYHILPAYDETVLSQIENCQMIGLFAEPPVISQNPDVNQGAIIFDPIIRRFPGPNPERLTAADLDEHLYEFINIHGDSPTPQQVIEATRLMTMVGKDEHLVTCGTEIVHGANIWAMNPATNAFRSTFMVNHSIIKNYDGDTVGDATAEQFQTYCTQFDWAPILYAWYHTGGTGTESNPDKFTFLGFLGDIDNLTYVPDAYLENINTAVLFNLFNI